MLCVEDFSVFENLSSGNLANDWENGWILMYCELNEWYSCLSRSFINVIKMQFEQLHLQLIQFRFTCKIFLHKYWKTIKNELHFPGNPRFCIQSRFEKFWGIQRENFIAFQVLVINLPPSLESSILKSLRDYQKLNWKQKIRSTPLTIFKLISLKRFP